MMIGKPVDAIVAQAVARTGTSGARSIEPGVAGDARVEAVQPAENVRLSDVGRAITTATGTVDEVRSDKVAAVKKAVDEGTYHVRAKVVADRMISEAAQLLEVMASSR